MAVSCKTLKRCNVQGNRRSLIHSTNTALLHRLSVHPPSNPSIHPNAKTKTWPDGHSLMLIHPPIQMHRVSLPSSFTHPACPISFAAGKEDIKGETPDDDEVAAKTTEINNRETTLFPKIRSIVAYTPHRVIIMWCFNKLTIRLLQLL